MVPSYMIHHNLPLTANSAVAEPHEMFAYHTINGRYLQPLGHIRANLRERDYKPQVSETRHNSKDGSPHRSLISQELFDYAII